VRVFTYGEGADDWLGLNVRRINAPTGKLGTNSVVAAIHLSLSESHGLREKTNREGFDQNETFERLRRIVLSVFEHLERLHAEDRQKLDSALRGDTEAKPIRFVEAIDHLRNGLKNHKLDQAFARDVNAIEQEFIELRDVMTNAGMAGLNLAVIFHEVEREVDALAKSVQEGLDSKRIREQIEHLHQLLQGFAPLLRKNPSRLTFVGQLIKAASRTRDSRFKFHAVDLTLPVLSGAEADFKVRGPSNLLIGALGNLLDNALYWSRVRKEREERSTTAAVTVRCQWNEKARTGMIAVIDNGTGFSMSDTRAVAAFTTTRPGGMGLGLYFANLVMEQCGGQLTIHAASELRDELDFPKEFDGAAVVMRFGPTP
jgi:signal transduction histidine kinase